MGGGFGGVTLAKQLEKDYQVILVSDSEYFECIPSFPFIIGDPNHVSKIRANYTSVSIKINIILI